MSQHIIVDSSALISLTSEDDSNHILAVEIGKIIEKQTKKIIIPGEIFTETVNLIGKKFSHKEALKFGTELIRSTEYEIVNTIDNIRETALRKFKNQPASVSFTDCLVMAFADEFETKEIFGFDNVFRKNSYLRFGIDKSKLPSPKWA